MRQYTLVVILCLLGWKGYAQSALEPVSVQAVFRNALLHEVLDEIEGQTGVQFMYSSSVIPLDKKMSVVFDGESLSNVLDEICRRLHMEYQVDGSRVLLRL